MSESGIAAWPEEEVRHRHHGWTKRPSDDRGRDPQMAKGPPLRVLLIVTGSTLRAEEMDRPLGYYLKQRIERSLSEAVADGRRRPGGLCRPRRGRLPLDPRRPAPEPADDLPGRSGRQRPGANDGSRKSPSRSPSTSATLSRWTPTWPNPTPVSGAWTTPRPRSPCPCSSTGSSRASSTAAPPLRPSSTSLEGEGEGEGGADRSRRGKRRRLTGRPGRPIRFPAHPAVESARARTPPLPRPMMPSLREDVDFSRHEVVECSYFLLGGSAMSPVVD